MSSQDDSTNLSESQITQNTEPSRQTNALPDTSTTLPIPPPETPKSFPRFNDLPPEIWCIIWDYSTKAIVIEVRQLDNNVPVAFRRIHKHPPLEDQCSCTLTHDFLVRLPPHTPPVPHVNRESRQRFLGTHVNLGSLISLNGVYFHPEIDTLHFRYGDDWDFIFKLLRILPHGDKIQNIAWLWRLWEGRICAREFPPESEDDLPYALQFPSLKRLFRVHPSTPYMNTTNFEELVFDKAPTRNRTYFNTIGPAPEDLQQTLCKEEWKDEILDLMKDFGEPWSWVVWHPTEELLDLFFSYDGHFSTDVVLCRHKHRWENGEWNEVEHGSENGGGNKNRTLLQAL